ncbi:hypothetical protein F7725_013726 [Dissostichus mawsoni]|uniref:Uncharacterized protein n=1 Tax=Dissostichus mawsoni TaxID=36200 RepID=A0A7J5YY33_DISMA|nr:hypothetical protein F7725_013726 [Dissostichus mawsoni]
MRRPSVLPRCVRSLRSTPYRTPAMRLPSQTRGLKTRRTRNQEEEWEEPEQNAADVHRCRRGGDDRPIAVLPGGRDLNTYNLKGLLSYASVPLYRLYCQATGLGGAATAGHDTDQVETMEPVKERILKITFNADTHSSMQWNFRPQQSEIYCFCFEEQRLNPHEEVDMPVFFYIDPEFDEDRGWLESTPSRCPTPSSRPRRGRKSPCPDTATAEGGRPKQASSSVRAVLTVELTPASLHSRGFTSTSWSTSVMENTFTPSRFSRSEERGSRSEERGSRIEDRGSRSEERGARIEERGSRSEDRGARSEERGSRSEERGARIEERGARSEDRGARIEDRGARSEERGSRIEERGSRSEDRGSRIG